MYACVCEGLCERTLAEQTNANFVNFLFLFLGKMKESGSAFSAYIALSQSSLLSVWAYALKIVTNGSMLS